ncbi:hypothetical protein L1785_09035 [Antribacter sp. KLBMP9083]|uniref:Uncharacterized protein n=1 Tax=Antribacter soli TaxID=2910976 RepID=A0AA41U737_9MICO|nr:hypothetical protein [Antribacter soli]MCF4121126.1 hypothetical protein [Antribacter soli]
MVSTLRAVLTAPRRGLAVAMAVLTLVLGVLVMHAMSGSVTVHVGPAAVLEPAHSAAKSMGERPIEPAGDGLHEPCASECAGHEHGAAEAMCAMMLTVLLALRLPGIAKWRLAPALLGGLRIASWLPASHAAGVRPSLHALGISRT